MLSRAFRLSRSFSAAPYNPHKYLISYISNKMPTKKEVFDAIESTQTGSGQLVHNMRHINPVRQSGPIPPFDGPFTMEDIIKNVYQEYYLMSDKFYPSTDAEEIMRRVPGTTREEAEFIRTLGLTPDDEVELAYWAKNTGLDIFYPMNNTYIARQVLTNSKGEKTEVVWPYMGWEDCIELSVDTALQDLPYQTIRHWEAFSGDEWYKYVNNIDLGMPDTWFEYEKNARFQVAIVTDQLEDLPDHMRPWPSPRNIHARKELWQSQSHMQYVEDIKKSDWNR
jgi:hypothetical protein